MLPRSFRLLLAALVVALATAGSAVAEAPQLNTNATISGSAAVGAQLTAHNGTWLYDNGTSCKDECLMTYQWERCDAGGSKCSSISGAEGRFYTVQAADAGSRLRAMETMSIYDCGAHNTQTGTIECNWTRRSAPSGMSAVVGGTAPANPTAPTTPAAPVVPVAVAPAANAVPTITGLAMVDQTLRAVRGTWGGTQPMTLALQWQRCDESGANCQDLGLSGETYKVIAFDIGKTLRVRVNAVNAGGTREAVSAPTAPVSALKPTRENQSLNAANVLAPHRLVVQQTSVNPRVLTRRGSVTVGLRVTDTRGFLIEGALVSAVVLPSASFAVPVEATSDAGGVAELTFAPGSKLNFKKLKSVTLVITARRPGDRLTSPRAGVVRVKISLRPLAARGSR
ncbi:MAG TPA: hypothetical protein VE444_09515 [Gaiellaceae bacterium]|nr:hypothetical protein [Gaiellaceae bacterium]